MLKGYQDAHGDNLVIQGADTLGRTHTERLVNSGYLQMVMKGWYIRRHLGAMAIPRCGMCRTGTSSLHI